MVLRVSPPLCSLPAAQTLQSFPCDFSERSDFLFLDGNLFGWLLSKVLSLACMCLQNPKGKSTSFGMLLILGSTDPQLQMPRLSGLGLF